MTFVRLLGVTILIYGFSYMRYAVTQMYLSFTSAPDPSPKFTVANLGISIVLFMLGIELLRRKDWARICWLMTLIPLLVVHLMDLILPRQSKFTMPILNLVLMVLLSLVSFWKLTRPEIKELFS
jgi:hypothetical protein